MKQSLWCALQPIVDGVTGRVVAHEALLRGPRNTPWESPKALFESAKALGHVELLEFNARRLAIGRQHDLPPDQTLFMNVNTINPSLPLGLHPSSRPERVALEISEQQPILDNPGLLEKIFLWRKAGHPIVLDDYGAGYMGPGAILTIRPDIIKIDRQLVEAIDRDTTKKILVGGVTQTAVTLGILVIAEGVETLDEFLHLRDLGIRYMQGFFFSKPSIHPRVEPFTLPPSPEWPTSQTITHNAPLPIL